jgi:hypothetical protein
VTYLADALQATDGAIQRLQLASQERRRRTPAMIFAAGQFPQAGQEAINAAPAQQYFAAPANDGEGPGDRFEFKRLGLLSPNRLALLPARGAVRR